MPKNLATTSEIIELIGKWHEAKQNEVGWRDLRAAIETQIGEQYENFQSDMDNLEKAVPLTTTLRLESTGVQPIEIKIGYDMKVLQPAATRFHHAHRELVDTVLKIKYDPKSSEIRKTLLAGGEMADLVRSLVDVKPKRPSFSAK